MGMSNIIVANQNNNISDTGPYNSLKVSVKKRIVICCRNNHKFLGELIGFDKHCNLILRSVNEIWLEIHKNNGSIIPKSKYSPVLILRGDTVILVLSTKAKC